MKSVFVSTEVDRSKLPAQGQLIRNFRSGNFVNLVLKVVQIPNEFKKIVKTPDNPEVFHQIHSVRYANTNFGNCIYLKGRVSDRSSGKVANGRLLQSSKSSTTQLKLLST